VVGTKFAAVRAPLSSASLIRTTEVRHQLSRISMRFSSLLSFPSSTTFMSRVIELLSSVTRIRKYRIQGQITATQLHDENHNVQCHISRIKAGSSVTTPFTNWIRLSVVSSQVTVRSQESQPSITKRSDSDGRIGQRTTSCKVMEETSHSHEQ